jgi:hypothetical protein
MHAPLAEEGVFKERLRFSPINTVIIKVEAKPMSQINLISTGL